MKKRVYFVMGAGIFLAAAFFALIRYNWSVKTQNKITSDIVSWCEADIDGDEKEELLVIRGAEKDKVLETGEPYGDCLEVYQEYEIKDRFKDRFKDIFKDTVNDRFPLFFGDAEYHFDLASIKPSKVMAGDIDGDGMQEIGVCVYKTTKFHPVLAKRPFFYRLKEGELEPVWLGSRLARPFLDYMVWDIDGDRVEEIVSIEKDQDGSSLIAVYDWKGFGFEVKAVSEKMPEDAVFCREDILKNQKIQVRNQGTCYQVQLEDDRVELVDS